MFTGSAPTLLTPSTMNNALCAFARAPIPIRGIEHARTGFVVDHGDHVDLVDVEIGLDSIQIKSLAPWHFDQMCPGIVNLGGLVQPLTKFSVGKDQDLAIADD